MEFWLVFLTCWLSGLAFIVWVVRRQTEDVNKRLPPPSPAPPLSAEELLKHRFVRGEIDLDEYERRLEVIRPRPIAAGQDGQSATALEDPRAGAGN